MRVRACVRVGGGGGGRGIYASRLLPVSARPDAKNRAIGCIWHHCCPNSTLFKIGLSYRVTLKNRIHLSHSPTHAPLPSTSDIWAQSRPILTCVVQPRGAVGWGSVAREMFVTAVATNALTDFNDILYTRSWAHNHSRDRQQAKSLWTFLQNGVNFKYLNNYKVLKDLLLNQSHQI